MPDSYKLATAVVGLVCLLSIFGWLTTGAEPAPVAAQTEEVKTLVSGRVERPGPDLTVHVVFPDLPYEVAAPVDPDTGTFEVPVEVVSEKPAGRYHLELSAGTRRWRVRSNQLLAAGPSQEIAQPLEVSPPPDPQTRNRPRDYQPAYSSSTTSTHPRHDRSQPKRHDRRRRRHR
ncbi:MAG: hypothetical protein KC910_07175 [Candidatus Eremiobacteraeota bacterium]|nr:hypothetical protein [Candidatus Eremiobacteraeota bacterium]